MERPTVTMCRYLRQGDVEAESDKNVVTEYTQHALQANEINFQAGWKSSIIEIVKIAASQGSSGPRSR